MFYSEFGQDEFIEKKVFKGLKNGSFFEIGAFDGVEKSNMLFFERERNWSGICVEPNPEIFEKLKENRKCECLQICISDEPGVVDFTLISGHGRMLSGITHKYHGQQKERISSTTGTKRICKVEAKTFNEIVASYNLKEIHYLSIDTEGSEEDILESIDYSNCFIHVITVEDNFDTKRSKSILLRNEFRYIQKLSVDKLFINSKSPFYNFECRIIANRNKFKDNFKYFKRMLKAKLLN